MCNKKDSNCSMFSFGLFILSKSLSKIKNKDYEEQIKFNFLREKRES